MTLYSSFRFLLILYFSFGMHFLMETPGGSGLYFSFNVIGWLIVTLIISITCWKMAQGRQIQYNNIHLLLLLGLLLLIVPFSYQAEFKDHAILRVLAVSGGLLFLFCLSQFKTFIKNKEQLLWMILIGVAIQACIGLIQFLILEKGDWPSYDPIKQRPFGLFMQINVMASFMATGLVIATYLLCKNNQQHLVRKTFCLVIIATTSLLLATLKSQTGYLGAIIGLLLLLPFCIKSNKKQFIIACFLIVIAQLVAQPLLKNKEKDYVNSASVRIPIYTTSLKMIIEKPLTGYGYGNFERSYLDFHNQLKLKAPEVADPILKLDHPHNEILYWGVEGGIVSLLGLVCFALAFLTILLKLPLTTSMVMLALVSPVLLHSQTEYPFYSSVSHWFVLLILFFYALSSTAIADKTLHLTSPFLLRFFAVLTSLVFVPFLLTTLHTGYLVNQYEKNGYRNISLLTNTINPLPWLSHIQAMTQNHNMFLALKEQDTMRLENYLAWANRRNRHSPRVSIYANMLLALKVMDKESDYQQLLTIANKTYPKQGDWSSSLLKELTLEK